MRDLQQFWNELAAWQQQTFGDDKVRGPQGPLHHLLEEIEEARQDPDNLEEYADQVFCLFDAARRAGLTYKKATLLTRADDVRTRKCRLNALHKKVEAMILLLESLSVRFALMLEFILDSAPGGYEDMLAALWVKLEKNKLRTWAPPDANEKIKHVAANNS